MSTGTESHPLDAILAGIAECERDGDYEKAHSVADRLLIKALETVAGGADLATRAGVRSIVAAWGEVPKWYA